MQLASALVQSYRAGIRPPAEQGHLSAISNPVQDTLAPVQEGYHFKNVTRKIQKLVYMLLLLN